MPENIRTSAEEITLREHLERLIKELDRRGTESLAALRRELDLVQKFTETSGHKADKVEEEWRKAANEWRGAMDKLITMYAPLADVKSLEKSLLAADEADRLKSEVTLQSLGERVSKLELKESGLSGRIVGIVATVAAILSAIGLVLQFLPRAP